MLSKQFVDNTISDPKGNHLRDMKKLYESLGYNVQIKSKPLDNIVSCIKKDQ